MDNDYKLVIKDAEAHIVLGPVYVPLSVDSDNETMTAEAIAKMAHDFLASGKVNRIDESHNFKENGSLVIESYLARKGDTDFVEGTWVVGTRITDPEVWAKVLTGELNGYSFAGLVRKEVVTVLVEAVDTISGNTEESTIDIVPLHKHTFMIKFNEDGSVQTGKTSEDLGHWHVVLAPDATEISVGHAHRIIT